MIFSSSTSNKMLLRWKINVIFCFLDIQSVTSFQITQIILYSWNKCSRGTDLISQKLHSSVSNVENSCGATLVTIHLKLSLTWKNRNLVSMVLLYTNRYTVFHSKFWFLVQKTTWLAAQEIILHSFSLNNSRPYELWRLKLWRLRALSYESLSKTVCSFLLQTHTIATRSSSEFGTLMRISTLSHCFESSTTNLI